MTSILCRLGLLGAFALTPLQAAVLGDLQSPDQQYHFQLDSDEAGNLSYTLQWKGRTMIAPSDLGLKLASGKVLGQGASLSELKEQSVDATWTPIYGEQSQYRDHYQEAFFTFGHGEDSPAWGIRVRAYNEGLAFRYELLSKDDVAIASDQTEFTLPASASAWATQGAQASISKVKLPALVGKNNNERPLLVEMPQGGYLALGEAGLVNFARMLFGAEKAGDSVSLKACLTANEKGKPTALLQGDNKTTPWRFVMAGDAPSDILQNNALVLNLNEPCKLQDTSWIKPGKVLREVTLSTQGAKACIDFAKRNNMEYIMFDAGWYGPENSWESDATTVTLDPARSKGPFSMPEILDYSKQHGVGVILYVNHRALEQQQDDIFPLYQKWGIAGIKYGFVNTGSQHWTNWLHESIAQASKYKMLVDVHDNYRPTGWSRTYPNFLTQEGIRGDEESPDNGTVINTIFTRMIVGAGDQTNCYYDSRVEKKMGSRASQMAKMICVYSPFQSVYWYDRPVGSPSKTGGAGGAESFILENDECKFYAQVPTVWDETKVIEGYPGEFVRMARRSGDTWFMGGFTGDKAHDYDITFDFLAEGQAYEASLYTDVDAADGTRSVKLETLPVVKGQKVVLPVAAKRGFAYILKPVKK